MGFAEITSEKRKNVPLLNRYQCRICKKWKEATCFANKETNGYKSKIAMGHKVNGSTAQLRCRLCAGVQLHELQCGGPCGTWKELEQFSKSARMAGGSGWCQACVLWKEAYESGIPGAAPPTGDIAPDEDVGPSRSYSHANEDTYQSDPEAGGSSEDDYPISTTSAWGASFAEPVISQYTTPVQQSGLSSTMGRPSDPPSALAQPSGHRSIASRPSAPSSNAARPPAPPATASRLSAPSSTVAHPSVPASSMPLGETVTAAMNQMSIGFSPWSSQNARPGAAHPVNNTSILPPHLRGRPSGPNPTDAAPRQASDTRTVSSASNPYEGIYTEATSQPSWGAIDARRRTPGPGPALRTYNAWDTNGVPHVQQRVLSSGTPSETGSVMTSTTTIPAVRPPPPATARNSNWAKPSGTRNYHRQVQYNPLEHQANPQRKVADDSDEDEDADDM